MLPGFEDFDVLVRTAVSPDFATEHFLKRLTLEDRGYKTPCIIWGGALGGAGLYGTFTWVRSDKTRKQMATHRIVYLALVGNFPEDKPLPDHLCRIHECCNPAHLEAVTNSENQKRGLNGSKTECKHHHAFTKENTYINTRGQRECKTCRRNAVRKSKGLGVVS